MSWPQKGRSTSSAPFVQSWVSGTLFSNSGFSANLLCDFGQVTDPLWAFVTHLNQRVV